MDFIKKLAADNNKVLYKTAIANYTIEYVDKDLCVVARVTPKKGSSKDFDLEKLGAMYSDETQKFYSLDTSDEMSRGEVHDLAITAYLTSKTAEPEIPSLKRDDGHVSHELSETEAEEEMEHSRDDQDELADEIAWDVKHKCFEHRGPHCEASKKTAEPAACHVAPAAEICEICGEPCKEGVKRCELCTVLGH